MRHRFLERGKEGATGLFCSLFIRVIAMLPKTAPAGGRYCLPVGLELGVHKSHLRSSSPLFGGSHSGGLEHILRHRFFLILPGKFDVPYP